MIISFIHFLITAPALLAQEAPAWIPPYSSITIQEAQYRNYRYVGDLLALQPGLWVRDFGSTGQWALCRMSGSYDNSVLLLINGRPVYDPWSGTHDLNNLSVEQIKKIEIYPTMNPFGYPSAGGVINIISKNIESNRPYTKVVYRTGKHNFSDLDVSFGQKIGKRWEIYSGALLKGYGEALPDMRYKGQKIHSKITFRPLQSWTVKYDVVHNKSDLEIPYELTMPGDTLILSSPNRKTLRYDHTFTSSCKLWKTNTWAQLYHTSQSYELREANFNPMQTFSVTYTGLSFKQQLEFIKIPLIWGLTTQERHFSDPYKRQFKDSYTRGFLTGRLKLFSGFSSVPQIFIHRSTDEITRVCTAHRLSWNPSQNFYLAADWSQGFRDPSIGERFGYPFIPGFPETADQILMQTHYDSLRSNPSLRPELSQTFAVELQWTWLNRHSARFRGFHRTVRDLIQIVDTNDCLWFDNRSQALFRGFETQMSIGLWYGFKIASVLNFTKSTDEDGDYLLERPNIWGNTSISWDHSFFQEDLYIHLCLSNRYWSEYWNLVINTQTQVSEQYISPGSILDMKISFTIQKHFIFSFSMDNLLNTKTTPVSTFHLPLRGFRFGFSWELFD
jgi:outer membrane cobalamin receptor